MVIKDALEEEEEEDTLCEVEFIIFH